jgi:hypothetical protein
VRVLVHRLDPFSEVAGVWWLPGHRQAPRWSYLQPGLYPDGARAILPVADANDGVLTLADWSYLIERLTESASPFSDWEVVEADDPLTVLVS